MTDPPVDDDIPFGGPDDEDLYDDGDRPEDRVDPKDMMSPPKVPCECYCLHCERVFTSDGIWFQKVIGSRDGFDGFWMCPTPNCDGAGFTFDIFPTDPTHPANGGWHHCDDDDDEDPEFDEEGNVIEAGRDKDYDPDENKYKDLDDELGDVDEDIIEGDEWKLGLSPGEPPPETEAQREARLRWEEEQKQYDAPDERPRILDWTNRKHDDRTEGTDEDIPF